MDPIKPNEAKPNNELENMEEMDSLHEDGLHEEVYEIDQKPNLAETGFNTDKSKVTQQPSSKPQPQPSAQDDQIVTNTTPYSQTNTDIDNTSPDALIEEIIRLDRSTNKPGKKAREELFKKAAKSQV